jgi:hypothetical protein
LRGEDDKAICEMRDPVLELVFPGLDATNYDVTSPSTPDYNCIAWAAADDANWWQPDPFRQYFWPANSPRDYAVPAYIHAFGAMGYVQCNGTDLEEGFEKVVIYVGRDGLPSHMARQLENGHWTSKVGSSFDISHSSVNDLQGIQYGTVACVLRRPR